MARIFTSLFLLFIVLFACKKKESGTEEVQASEVTETSIIRSERPIERLNPKSQALMTKWPEYQKFHDLIDQYQEISMNEALLNSVELATLAQQLKDSIRIEKFNVPDVKIRLNVLYTETLRLADMSSIPTITEDMVAQENDNMIAAFSALNMKINNMNRQDQLNSEVSKFVDEVLQETKSDSTQNPENN